MKIFFKELEHKKDIKTKLKQLKSDTPDRSSLPRQVSNDYASVIIPEGRFNMQEEMRNNENTVSDKIHAKLEK